MSKDVNWEGTDHRTGVEDVQRQSRNLAMYARYAEEHLKAGRLDSAAFWLMHARDEAARALGEANGLIEGRQKIAAADLDARR